MRKTAWLGVRAAIRLVPEPAKDKNVKDYRKKRVL